MAEQAMPRAIAMGKLADSPASGALFIVAMLTVWELCARLIAGFVAYLPAFSTIVATIGSMTLSGEMVTHTAITLRRLALAYLWAGAVALPLGLFVGQSRLLFKICEPTLELLRPAPAIAIMPIAMLVFGLDDRMKVLVIAWGVFWAVFLNTIDAVRSVDAVLQDTARAYGYRGWKLLWRVVLPASLPYAMAGLRLGLTVALVLGIFVEVFTGGSGLGYLVQHYNELIRMPEMYAAVLVIAVIGFLLYNGFELVEMQLVGWHRKIREAA